MEETKESKFIECPKCKKLVKPSYLPDHRCYKPVKHSNYGNSRLKNKPVSARENSQAYSPPINSEKITSTEGDLVEKPVLEGVELKNSDIADKFKSYVVDESGMLINPDLIKTNQRKSRDERMGTVPLPKRPRKQKISIFNKPKPQATNKPTLAPEKQKEKLKKKNKIPGSLKRTNKFITRNEVVKCPICGAERIYGELFTHVQTYHPKENAKIVLDQFNRLHGIGKYRHHSPDSERTSTNVSAKETFRQADDDPRDGGKYVGYMRRERGKFGSLPLHDDYSDEADAE